MMVAKISFWLSVVLVFGCMMFLALFAHAQTLVQCSVVTPCSVFWTGNTEPDLKDYRVFVRKVPALYSTTPLLTVVAPQTALGAPQFMGAIGTLAAGQYAIAVTARDQALNESAKSLEVFFEFVVVDITPPIPPTLNIIRLTIP